LLPPPGDPHVSLYPIRRVSFQVAPIKGSDPVLEWREGSGPSKTIENRESPGALSLQTALAYGAGAGLSATLEVLTNLITVFHSPRNHLVTLTLGNSDGITKCFRLFGERGDTFLADELSFSALTNAVTAQGVAWAPVKIDDGGLIPEELERILSSWNTRRQGKFPHVLYTVPYDSPVPFSCMYVHSLPTPQLWPEPHWFNPQPRKEEENLRHCSEIRPAYP
jgi:aromatic amino acid aminotransferase I / 2-aminoadipate transaminase